MRRLVSLTNIPTPYRVYFYNRLSQQAEARAIALDVVFMASSEPGRHWALDKDSWAFRYSFPRGLHPMVGNRLFHFNPSVLYTLATKPPEWLLLSGSWFLPTVQLATLISKPASTKTLFWSESNLAYVEHEGGLAGRWRSWTMNQFSGSVVPGRWAREYVLRFLPPHTERPMLQLPNVVNEALFRDEVAIRRLQSVDLRRKWGIKQSRRPILLTVARLEPIKAVDKLVTAALALEPGSVLLLIAGTGSQAAQLQAAVSAADRTADVRFLGHLAEDEIIDLLAIADAFVLPSMGDPYPLAVIEAAFAGLPLLLSNRVGCHPEALVAGENGLLFDPTDPEDIGSALLTFVERSPEQRAKMGRRSLEIATDKFTADRVIDHFLDQLIAL
jgi:glycosyltransferase involved in cell wall biosynthesis